MRRAGFCFAFLLAAHGVALDAAPLPSAAPAAGAVALPGVYVQHDLTVPLELIVERGRFSEWFLRQVRAEAESIWKRNGVTLVWRTGPANPCETPLRVWIEDAPGPAVVNKVPMGSILFHQGVPLRAIYLSPENVEALLRKAQLGGTDRPLHDLLVARALGRTLAHEVGHYVLNRQTHETRGLMRATWPIQEAVAGDRRKFELTPALRAVAWQRLAAEPMTCGGASIAGSLQ